jgi:hypothetical protein
VTHPQKIKTALLAFLLIAVIIQKILAIFPMDTALKYPQFGDVKKPLSVVPYDEIGKHANILIIRTYQSNDLFNKRVFHTNTNKLEIIKEFCVKGKKVTIYQKKKRK